MPEWTTNGETYRKAPGHFVTVDGVHMNPLGNEMMAIGVLRAFGLNQGQINKAEKTWLDIPRSSTLDGREMLTLKQYKKLDQLAAKRGVSVQDLANEIFAKAVVTALK